jgi:hypothetical protein
MWRHDGIHGKPECGSIFPPPGHGVIPNAKIN